MTTKDNPLVSVYVNSAWVGRMKLSVASAIHRFNIHGLAARLVADEHEIRVENRGSDSVTVEFVSVHDFGYQKFYQSWSEMEDQVNTRIDQCKELYNSIIRGSGIEYDPAKDLLRSGNLWVMDTGVVCKRSDGNSFYTAEMLGNEWQLHTRKAANKFVAGTINLKDSMHRHTEAEDLATYKRLQKRFGEVK